MLYDGINFNKCSDGYWLGVVNKKVKSLHVYIWEEHNQCKVPQGYVIHHKDEDKDNNDITNLALMTCSDHNRLHMTGNRHWLGKNHTEETKAKLREANSGNKNGMYGRKEDKQHATERGKAISEAKLKPTTPEMIEDIKNGISKRKFIAKYGTEGVWIRVRKELATSPY